MLIFIGYSREGDGISSEWLEVGNLKNSTIQLIQLKLATINLRGLQEFWKILVGAAT